MRKIQAGSTNPNGSVRAAGKPCPCFLGRRQVSDAWPRPSLLQKKYRTTSALVRYFKAHAVKVLDWIPQPWEGDEPSQGVTIRYTKLLIPYW